MREQVIEERLRKEVIAIGGLCLKFTSPGYTGVPDRIVFLPGGHVVLVELKAPGKTERPRQIYVQEQLRSLGLPVFSSVDSYTAVERVILFCKELMESERVYDAD